MHYGEGEAPAEPETKTFFITQPTSVFGFNAKAQRIAKVIIARTCNTGVVDDFSFLLKIFFALKTLILNPSRQKFALFDLLRQIFFQNVI